MNVATLRSNFPEFADVARYPDAQVSFWLDIGVQMLNANRWSTSLDFGLQLFTAHHLAIAYQSAKVAAAGGVPGLSSGPASAKSVDKVSVSYDTTAGLEVGAGHWNLTIYGTQFIRLAKMMGSGGLQII